MDVATIVVEDHSFQKAPTAKELEEGLLIQLRTVLADLVEARFSGGFLYEALKAKPVRDRGPRPKLVEYRSRFDRFDAATARRAARRGFSARNDLSQRMSKSLAGVQRDAGRMRVNVQLIDTETGNHLWADRFDKPLARPAGCDILVSPLAQAAALGTRRSAGPKRGADSAATENSASKRDSCAAREFLERAGFVVVKRPAISGGAAIGRGYEG